MEQVFILFKTGLESCLEWFNIGLDYTGAAPYIIAVVSAMLVVSLLIAPLRGNSFIAFGNDEKKNRDRSFQAQCDNRSVQKQKNVG